MPDIEERMALRVRTDEIRCALSINEPQALSAFVHRASQPDAPTAGWPSRAEGLQ